MSKKRKEKENVHQKIQSSWPNNIEATCFFVTLFHSIERQQTGPYHFSFRSRDDRVLEMWDTPLGEQTKASGFPRVENRKQRKGGRPDIFIIFHDPETSVRASRVFFRDENPPWHPLELPAVGNQTEWGAKRIAIRRGKKERKKEKISSIPDFSNRFEPNLGRKHETRRSKGWKVKQRGRGGKGERKEINVSTWKSAMDGMGRLLQKWKFDPNIL